MIGNKQITYSYVNKVSKYVPVDNDNKINKINEIVEGIDKNETTEELNNIIHITI